MHQLPESSIPYRLRVDRILEVLEPAGCTPAELWTDLEVAESVRNLDPR
jgi:hypothetical protein